MEIKGMETTDNKKVEKEEDVGKCWRLSSESPAETLHRSWC